MPDTTITNLPADTTLTGTELVPADSSGVTTAITTQAIADLAGMAAHAADTTGVHGIVDTAALETSSGAQIKADAAEDFAIQRTNHTGAQAISTVTGLQTALDAKLVKASGVGVVVHGAAAGTARPTGYASIMWIGSVSPTNADPNVDTYLGPS